MQQPPPQIIIQRELNLINNTLEITNSISLEVIIAVGPETTRLVCPCCASDIVNIHSINVIIFSSLLIFILEHQSGA